MKKTIILVLFLFFVTAGCGRAVEKGQALVKVNNYEITRLEFEEAFKESPYAKNDTPQSRREFLEQFISRKLILQDAEAKGLDRDKNFLKMVERFWEQYLLKLALDKKSEEIAGSVKVSESLVQGLYYKMVKEGATDQPYENMRERIRWEVVRSEEAKLINKWLDELRGRADIKVDEELLNKDK
ncbi:MAG TPA: hypothetical protein DCL35_08250 [Candidatus Omnitrophica bacterium]|nr:hypothetical protein [Candidatus Omnitrophota bacterium]